MGISLKAKQETGLKGRVGKQEAFRAFMKRWPSGVWGQVQLEPGWLTVAPCSAASSRPASSLPPCPEPRASSNRVPHPPASVLPWLPVATPLGTKGHLRLPQPTCPFGLHCLLSIAPSWDPTHPPACSSLNALYLSQPLQFLLCPPPPPAAVLPPQIASQGTLGSTS